MLTLLSSLCLCVALLVLVESGGDHRDGHGHHGHGHADADDHGHNGGHAEQMRHEHGHDAHAHDHHDSAQHSVDHHHDDGSGSNHHSHDGHGAANQGTEDKPRRKTEGLPAGGGRLETTQQNKGPARAHVHGHGADGHGTHDHAKAHPAHEQGHGPPGAAAVAWAHAYASAIGMSIISFIGVCLLSVLKIPSLAPTVECCCLAFAATVLVGDALLHLLPHALEGADHDTMTTVGLSAVAGCLAILLVPEVLGTEHHHNHGEDAKHEHASVAAYGWANLVTEGLHNFVDGISLGLAWVAGAPSGWATTLAVAVHELPQELGDFMVLRAAGFSVGKLLFWNFLVSLTCVLGVSVVHVLGQDATAAAQKHLTAFTAGTFLSLSMNMIYPQVSESIRSKFTGAAAVRVRLFCCVLSVVALYVLVKLGDLESHDHGHDHGHEHAHGHAHSHVAHSGHSHGHPDL